MPLWLQIICYLLSGHVLGASLSLWAGIVPWPYDRLFKRTILWRPFKDKDHD